MPVLLLLFLGIVELGRVFNLQNTVTNAARGGARFAVATDRRPSVADVREYVLQYLENPDGGVTRVPRSAVESVTVETDGAGGRVVVTDMSSVRPYAPVFVTVRVNHHKAAWMPMTRILADSTVEAVVVMRKEP